MVGLDAGTVLQRVCMDAGKLVAVTLKGPQTRTGIDTFFLVLGPSLPRPTARQRVDKVA